MILIDPRSGSGDTIDLFKNKGIEVAHQQLEAADYAFEGNGPNGTCMFGVERKRIKDMMQSIRSGRFSGHQLPMLSQMYKIAYLVVEGMYRPEPHTGILQEYKGSRLGWQDLKLGTQGFMYREIDKFLMSIEIFSGIKVRRTSTDWETAELVVNLYRYFNDKHWTEHRAHQSFNTGTTVALFRPPLIRRVAKELPHIGMEYSGIAAQKFGNCINLINATEAEWQEIQGIGPKKSSDIVKAIWGLEDQ